MSLFQQSVLNKYLKEANQNEIKSAFEKLVAYFHNPEIQQNIRESKEEQFQEGFLRELFVTVFGYTINPTPDFNLTTEFKNERGAKKADGAILQNGAAIAVIELKSTKTKDLESIRLQAFDYKANQQKCVYVITSNFEKVRFYINNAVDFEEFDLFKLKYEGFQLLWLCLAKENFFKGVPLAIKEASILKEEKITKQIYVDYSLFKRELYADLIQNNLTLDFFSGKEEKEIKLLLFKKSQKLLDRFLFIFFGEDRGLLPPNSISKIIDKWNHDKDWGDSKSLYSIFEVYFKFLNVGRPARGERAEIFAYNGGLFLPDEVLDNIIISDEVLNTHTKVLTAYDFETDVDVNILGHIFENSLNEIEEITAQIEGAEVDLKKSKRKKDGVFYTPKYITKYIVENTVGKLCDEKKTELVIEESEYLKNRKGRTKRKLLELSERLDNYRNWLLTLTICDPACGSGAFLNQALDFLIREHHYIDELKAKLLDVPMVFTEVENSILENNIFGVDINEESVEIAKLSLWLRTAQRGRKLTTLSNNIKCGNSLIDDPDIAGEKTFNWQNEFPEVFKNGGFDVVIGNPPYVRQELFSSLKDYFEKHYKTYSNTADLYTYFIEKGVDGLIHSKGIYSIIVANKWMRAKYGRPLRIWMKNKEIIEIIDFKDLPIFQEATTYPCIITICRTQKTNNINVCEPKNLKFGDLKSLVSIQSFLVNKKQLNDEGWSLVDKQVSSLLDKLRLKGISLGNFVNKKIFYGIKTGFNEAFVIDKKRKDEIIYKNPNCINVIKPFVAGRDIKRYNIDFQEKYLIVFPRGFTNKNRGRMNPEEYLMHNFAPIFEHLIKYKEKCEKRSDKGDYWWELRACAYYNEFDKPKLILPDISLKGNFALDKNNSFYCVNTCYIIPTTHNWLEALLNSRLITFYYKLVSPEFSGGYLRFIYQYLVSIPIIDAHVLAESNEKIKGQIISYSKLTSNMIRLISLNFSIEYLSKKLQNWHELEFAEFIKELNKAIKKASGEKLSKMDEMEWMEVFETKKAEAQNLKSEIEKTDREIDQMVYELYGLTEEEIGIVEGS